MKQLLGLILIVLLASCGGVTRYEIRQRVEYLSEDDYLYDKFNKSVETGEVKDSVRYMLQTTIWDEVKFDIIYNSMVPYTKAKVKMEYKKAEKVMSKLNVARGLIRDVE